MIIINFAVARARERVLFAYRMRMFHCRAGRTTQFRLARLRRRPPRRPHSEKPGEIIIKYVIASRAVSNTDLQYARAHIENERLMRTRRHLLQRRTLLLSVGWHATHLSPALARWPSFLGGGRGSSWGRYGPLASGAKRGGARHVRHGWGTGNGLAADGARRWAGRSPATEYVFEGRRGTVPVSSATCRAPNLARSALRYFSCRNITVPCYFIFRFHHNMWRLVIDFFFTKSRPIKDENYLRSIITIKKKKNIYEFSFRNIVYEYKKKLSTIIKT